MSLMMLHSFVLIVLSIFTAHVRAAGHRASASAKQHKLQGQLLDQEENHFTSYYLDVVREMPHTEEPFTQGLEMSPDEKYLIESTGAFPAGTPSFVRTIDPATGETVLKKTVFGTDFLEGIVQVPGQDGTVNWLTSTYNTNTAYVLDENFKVIKQEPYPWEGWGLSRDDKSGQFYATNGSEFLMTLQRKEHGFETVDTKPVTCMGKTVAGINELEMVQDFPHENAPRLFGNLMGTRVVIIINPTTGKCTGAFHLQDVTEVQTADEQMGYHVANGVAYSKTRGTFILTGKNWRKMYEAKLQTTETGASPQTLLSTFLATAPAVPPGAHQASLLNSGSNVRAMIAANANVSWLQQREKVMALQVPGDVVRREVKRAVP